MDVLLHGPANAAWNLLVLQKAPLEVDQDRGWKEGCQEGHGLCKSPINQEHG
jgi:hypothetical protein